MFEGLTLEELGDLFSESDLNPADYMAFLQQVRKASRDAAEWSTLGSLVARRDNTPTEVLRFLAEVGGKVCIWALLYREELPAEIQRMLLVSHPEERYYLAHRGNLPADLMEEFLRDESPQVQQNLAKNPSLPPEIQVAWSKDPLHLSGRHSYLAQNEALVPEAMSNLLENLTEDVTSRLATHPGLPSAGIDRLIQYSVGSARTCLATRKDLSLGQARKLLDGAQEVQCALAGYTTHPEIVEVLARSDDLSVLAQLATNTLTTPVQIDRILAECGDRVSGSIARRSNLTFQQQIVLLQSMRSRTVAVLALNPTIREEILRRILNNRRLEHAWPNAYQNPSLVLGDDLDARAYQCYRPQEFNVRMEALGVDEETWQSLLPNWEGSLAGLAETSKLVLR